MPNNEANNMVPVMLMLRHKQSATWDGHGRKEFAVLPRIGEQIEIGISETGYAYRVVMVRHPENPASCAADVYAVYESTTVDENIRLLQTP
jgi:hypothetical protein